MASTQKIEILHDEEPVRMGRPGSRGGVLHVVDGPRDPQLELRLATAGDGEPLAARDRLLEFARRGGAERDHGLPVALGDEFAADLVAGGVPGHEARIVARGPGDAPEVDGLVIIDGGWEDVGAGDFIEVQVTGYDDHDLFAEPL